MDVAKRLADWKAQSPDQRIAVLNRYLPPGVTAVLVIALAYQLATITWSLAPDVPSALAPIAPSGGTSPGVTERSSDFGTLADQHLFGQAANTPAPVVEAVVDAPETNLNLTLTGIGFGEHGMDPQAIISSNRGQEKNYRVGQVVENADGATLHTVYADRVLLNRSGRLETLRLPKEPTGAGVASTAMQRPVLEQPSGNTSLRQAIVANASRLTDVIRPAPHVQEGRVVGFRVNPGRDRATFDALGLQPGDVVTDINGTVLDDPSQGLQVFESLGESTQANVTVLREGVPQVLVIDTTQLQNLQEKRE